jgi:hypothetical protein
MIPTTFGAFIAFLGLIAPGLVFQLRRESGLPGYEESAFRELSRVALTSLIFTLMSLAVLAGLRYAGLRYAWPQAFVDPRAWLALGNGYLEGHLVTVAATFASEVFLSCVLALGAAYVTARHGRGHLSPSGVWYQVLRRDRPVGTRPWLTLHLADGTELSGLLRHYTETRVLQNQEIAIGGPQMTLRSATGSVSEIGAECDAVIVRGDCVQYITVRYQDRDRQLVRRRTEKSPQGKRPLPTAGGQPAMTGPPATP